LRTSGVRRPGSNRVRDGHPQMACDLLDGDAAERCLGEALDQRGPISILINAVGLVHSAPLVNVATRSGRRHSLEAWQRVIDINLTAVFVATVNIVDWMVSSRTSGVVVNFS